jgi:hypothetical protein
MTTVSHVSQSCFPTRTKRAKEVERKVKAVCENIFALHLRREGMPNWCECDLRVEGSSNRVTEFLEAVWGENGLFDFEMLIPYPDKYKELDRLAFEWNQLPPEAKKSAEQPKDGFNLGGYEWCLANWGTKWNAACATVGDVRRWGDLAEVDICFDTAWSPPKPAIKKASALFPDLLLDLRYFECGARFHGMYVCRGGEVEIDECGDYFGRRGG